MGRPLDELTATGRLRLAALLETEGPLDEAFERIFDGARDDAPTLARPIQAVIPPEAVASPELFGLLQSVQAEYDEIEAALSRLRERADLAADLSHDAALAFVSESELADPRVLARVLEPLQSHRVRFEVLFTQAKRALERLDPYALSRLPADELVRELRGSTERAASSTNARQSAALLTTLEYAVDFLRSLQRAADSFEALDLPRWDIRQYLEHLYLTENWSEMERLVRQLEKAVLGYLAREASGGPGRTSPAAPP